MTSLRGRHFSLHYTFRGLLLCIWPITLLKIASVCDYLLAGSSEEHRGLLEMSLINELCLPAPTPSFAPGLPGCTSQLHIVTMTFLFMLPVLSAFLCSSFISLVLIKVFDKSNIREERVYLALSSRLQSIILGKSR